MARNKARRAASAWLLPLQRLLQPRPTPGGCNPAKRGRASHPPLMAFIADTRMIANCWLRPGNSSSANNAQGFLANTRHRLGGKQVALLRADSGFCDSAFLDHLDQQQLHYIIALRQNQPLQRALVECSRVNAQG